MKLGEAKTPSLTTLTSVGARPMVTYHAEKYSMKRAGLSKVISDGFTIWAITMILEYNFKESL